MNLLTLFYTHPMSPNRSYMTSYSLISFGSSKYLMRVFFTLQWYDLSILYILTWTSSIHYIGKVYTMFDTTWPTTYPSCGLDIIRMSQQSCNLNTPSQRGEIFHIAQRQPQPSHRLTHITRSSTPTYSYMVPPLIWSYSMGIPIPLGQCLLCKGQLIPLLGIQGKLRLEPIHDSTPDINLHPEMTKGESQWE